MDNQGQFNTANQTQQSVQQTEVDIDNKDEPQEIGRAKPEHGPIGNNQERVYITESQPEIKLHPEVEKAGVEVAPPEEIKVLEQVTRIAGLEPAKEAVPVNTEPTGKVQLPPLPFSNTEVDQVIKTTKLNESKHWLAALTKYVIESIKNRLGEK